jgi:hypothetical protein
VCGDMLLTFEDKTVVADIVHRHLRDYFPNIPPPLFATPFTLCAAPVAVRNWPPTDDRQLIPYTEHVNLVAAVLEALELPQGQPLLVCDPPLSRIASLLRAFIPPGARALAVGASGSGRCTCARAAAKLLGLEVIEPPTRVPPPFPTTYDSSHPPPPMKNDSPPPPLPRSRATPKTSPQ